jgi:hypothetical protein
MNPYDKLLTLVIGSQSDYEKAVKGNDSARYTKSCPGDSDAITGR